MGSYSNSNAALEPKYFIPDHPMGAVGVDGAGWMVSRRTTTTVGVPSGNLANNRYVLRTTYNDLSARSSGNGDGVVLGLELSIFKRFRISVEADCFRVGYRKIQQKDSLLDDFSCGLSYRVGLKVWNYFIPYFLAGVEHNSLRGNGSSQFTECDIIDFQGLGGGVDVHKTRTEVRAYNMEGRRRFQSTRLGVGFEFEFLEHFRFRCDCLWTLNKRVVNNFRTETPWLDGAVPLGLPTVYGNTAKMILRYKKFTTRFGVVMLF
jgi:hypothetical protein